MNLKKISYAVIFFLILLGCKEEEKTCDYNPGRCEILMGHTWELEELKIDSIDSLALFMLHPTYCNQYKFEVISDNYYFVGSDCNGNSPTHQYGGTWNFSENFIGFNFDYTTKEYYGPVFLNYLDSGWNIEVLDDDKIWLNQTYKNKYYELHFKAK